MNCGITDMNCGITDMNCGITDMNCGITDMNCGITDMNCGITDMNCGNCETCKCACKTENSSNKDSSNTESLKYYFGPTLFKSLLDNLKDTAPTDLVDQIRYYAESTLPLHAVNELSYAGMGLEDTGIDGHFARDVVSIVWLFATQGHSGGSASVALPTIERLLSHNVLTPLLGTDEEWNDMSTYEDAPPGTTLQNRRVSSVFKSKGVVAYTLDGLFFINPEGQAFGNQFSKLTITFPYLPVKPKYLQLSQSLVDNPELLELFLLDQGEPLYYGPNLDNYEKEGELPDLQVKRKLYHSKLWGTN